MSVEKSPRSLRIDRLPGNAIDRLFKTGKRVSHPALTLIVSDRTDGSCIRLGVIVGKAIANDAAPRNRLRRIIRESFRINAGAWSGRSLDCILLARPSAKSFEKRAQVDEVVQKLLMRL